MSIMEYNGAALVAMAGKNCIAIASDTRFGIQQQTVATNLKKVYKINDTTMIGMTGLISDMQTLINKFQYRINLYEMNEGRTMSCDVFANMVSQILYEKRFGPYFMEPVIAGLKKKTNDETGEVTYSPYLCGMDLLGAPVYTDNFMVAGTTSNELFGVCEAFFKPDLEPEELFEVVSQSLMAAQDRDCLAGWGAIVHIVTPDGILTRELKARQD